MINIFKLKKIKYFSDILVNEPPNSWENWNLKVLDYTENPNQLLMDRDKFIQKSTKPLIRVKGYVAGLDTKMFSNPLSLYYTGFIILGQGEDKFPLYFRNYRYNQENPNLDLEASVLKAGKDYPLIITGVFFPKFEDNKFPYSLLPSVIQMGDYICPIPKKKE